MPSTKVNKGVYWSERTKTWHYEVRINGKKRNGNTGLPNQKLAIDYVADLRRASSREKDGLPPEVQTPTLRQALEAWDAAMKGKVEDRHRGDMRRLQTHAAAFLDTPLDRLDNRAVDGPEGILATYLKTTGTGYHDAKLSHTLGGANTLLKLLRSLCGWAITQGLLTHRPFTVKDRAVREEPRGVVWPELVQKFCLEADLGGRGRTEKQKATEELHSAVAIRIMLALGVREDECLNAEWGWIDWRTSVYTVKKTKNRRIRTIPMPAWLKTYLETLWVKAGKPTKGLILPDHYLVDGVVTERPHGKNFTAKPVARCARKLGIPDLTPHRLRATFATTHFEAGTPLSQISQMMGHTGKTAPTTTMGYIVQRPKAQAKSQEKVAKLQGFQSPISPPKKVATKPKKSNKSA
jgi:integrase